MTSTEVPSAQRCPGCAGSLPAGADRCPSCGLPLRGPLAAELWRIDWQLASLRARRTQVIGALRGAPADVAPDRSTPSRVVAPAGSGQRLLLVLGVGVLLVAAVVFLAVAWDVIGVAGQVATMAAACAGCVAAADRLAASRLSSTAEAVGWLGVGLAAVSLGAARNLGVAGLENVEIHWYAVGSALLLAGFATAAALLAPRVAAFPAGAAAAAALAPLPVLVHLHPGMAGTAVGCLLLAAVLGTVAVSLRGFASLGAAVAAVFAAGYLLVAVAAGLGAAAASPAGPSTAVGAGVCLLVSGAAALPWWTRAAGGPGELLAACAAALAAVDLTLVVRHAGPAGTTLAGLAAAALAASAFGVSASGTAASGVSAPGRPRCTIALYLPASLLLVLTTADAVLSGQRASATMLLAGVAVTACAVALTESRQRPVASAITVLALGAAGIAACAGQAAVTAYVLLGTGAGAVTVAAWRRMQPEEPALLAAAGAVTVAALAAGHEAATHPPLASLVLAVTGLTMLGYALLPGRGQAAVLGVAGLSVAEWLALSDAHVRVVEAYTLPAAALALAVGLLRIRREPLAPSWTTVGPACSLALLPSALVGATSIGFGRAAAVLVAGTVVLVLGIRLRWQAPTVTAAAAVAVVALGQLAPYAVGLPRWLTLGAVGAALIVAGATYERRLADLRRAGGWVGALR